MNNYLHKPIVDCPYCGAKPPIVHYLGGGPGFEGIRVCGNGCGTWDDDDEKTWQMIHNVNVKKQYNGFND